MSLTLLFSSKNHTGEQLAALIEQLLKFRGTDRSIRATR